MDTGSYKVSALNIGSSLNTSPYTSAYWGTWHAVSSGGTPSSSTGVSASGFIYYEATGTGTGHNSSSIRATFLKHTSFTATSDSMRFQWYNYGQYIGSLSIGIRVV